MPPLHRSRPRRPVTPDADVAPYLFSVSPARRAQRNNHDPGPPSRTLNILLFIGGAKKNGSYSIFYVLLFFHEQMPKLYSIERLKKQFTSSAGRLASTKKVVAVACPTGQRVGRSAPPHGPSALINCGSRSQAAPLSVRPGLLHLIHCQSLPAVPHLPSSSPMPPPATARATPAVARPSQSFSASFRRSRPSAARPPAPGRRAAVCCSCTPPSDWDWTRWCRHFDEVDRAESDASLLEFQLAEAVQNEDFAEAAKLRRAILEAAGNDAVARVMSDLKSAIEEQRYRDATRLTRLARTSLVGWWVGYGQDFDDFIGRIVRISPGVGRYVAKSYTPRQLTAASSGTPLFEIFLVRDNDETYTMKVVHLQPAKEISTASTISFTAKEAPSESSLESIAISDTVTEETNTNTDLNGNEEFDKKEQGVGNTKDSSIEQVKSVLNFSKPEIQEFNVQVRNVDVPEETELAKNSSEELIQDDVKGTSDDSLEGPTPEELHEEDVPKENMDRESKDTEVKHSVSGAVHNEEDTVATKPYVRDPAEIKKVEKDSFELYISGKGFERYLAEIKASKQKLTDMAVKIVSELELMPSDAAESLWGPTKSTQKVHRERARELLRATLSKTRVNLTENTIFHRIITDTNNTDPFNGLYVGAFSPYGPEILQLRRKYGNWNSTDDAEFFEYVEAVKLTGDLSVPAGEIAFRAKIGKGGLLENRGAYPEEFGVIAIYKGQGRIAQPGFKNPSWLPGELLVLDGKSTIPQLRGARLGFLYILPEQSVLVLFDQLKLPE